MPSPENFSLAPWRESVPTPSMETNMTQVGSIPDVVKIERLPAAQLSEVNDRISRHGWVLLQILVERRVTDGSFRDYETYVIGLKRSMH